MECQIGRAVHREDFEAGVHGSTFWCGLALSCSDSAGSLGSSNHLCASQSDFCAALTPFSPSEPQFQLLFLHRIGRSHRSSLPHHARAQSLAVQLAAR